MGDGVLVYFGYPAAHEDDAERAVRAGLAIIAAVPLLRMPSITLQARVGIASGLAVVGDLTGPRRRRWREPVGSPPSNRRITRLQELLQLRIVPLKVEERSERT
jgi:class 3 adenylate cyclase